MRFIERSLIWCQCGLGWADFDHSFWFLSWQALNKCWCWSCWLVDERIRLGPQVKWTTLLMRTPFSNICWPLRCRRLINMIFFKLNRCRSFCWLQWSLTRTVLVSLMCPFWKLTAMCFEYRLLPIIIWRKKLLIGFNSLVFSYCVHLQLCIDYIFMIANRFSPFIVMFLLANSSDLYTICIIYKILRFLESRFCPSAIRQKLGLQRWLCALQGVMFICVTTLSMFKFLF